MKRFKLTLFLVLTMGLLSTAQANKACDVRMAKIMSLMNEARTCTNDSDCMVTQVFSEKLFCGKNKAINRKANTKKIIAVIDSIKNCTEGGSCSLQKLIEPFNVKCVSNECQIIE